MIHCVGKPFVFCVLVIVVVVVVVVDLYILRHQTSVWGFVSDDVVLTECMGLEDSLCLCTPFVVSVYIFILL